MSKDWSQDVNDAMQQSRTDRAWLFEVPIPDGSVKRVTDWTDSIEYPEGSGNTFEPTVLNVPSFKQDDKQQLPTMEVEVGNIDKRIQTELKNNDGLVDTDVRVIAINPPNNQSGDEVIDQKFRVKNSGFNQKILRFNLTSFLDQLNTRLTRTIDHTTFPNIPKTRVLVR